MASRHDWIGQRNFFWQCRLTASRVESKPNCVGLCSDSTLGVTIPTLWGPVPGTWSMPDLRDPPNALHSPKHSKVREDLNNEKIGQLQKEQARCEGRDCKAVLLVPLIIKTLSRDSIRPIVRRVNPFEEHTWMNCGFRKVTNWFYHVSLLAIQV